MLGNSELSFLSHCDGLQYVRVNDLGAFALGRTDEGPDLLFIGDGTIIPGQELYLEKIAERKEVDRWRLSASSVLESAGFVIDHKREL